MSKNKKLSDFVKSMDSAAVDSFLFTGDTSTGSSAGNFTISPALPGGQTSWNVNTAGALEITEAGRWTFTAVDNGSISLSMKGAGGGYGRDSNAVGGTGGLTTGKINYSSGDTFVVTVGSKGTQQGTAGTYGGGGAGGALTFPGSGGGYSGIFTSSETQSNAILIAGGGGGGHGWDAGSAQGNGGQGGGSEGSAGTDGSAGAGGTQSAGGAGSGNGTSGSALTGGAGGNRGSNQGSGGGGGGGYYGGGGGAAGVYNGNQNGTSGGGGSGYIGGATGYTVTDGVTTAGSGSIVETDGTFSILAGSGGGSGRSSSARPLRTSDITNINAPYDSASTLALIDSAYVKTTLGSSSFADSDANQIMAALSGPIVPTTNTTLGTTSKKWKDVYTNKLSFGGIYIDTNGLDGGNATLSTFATPSDYSYNQVTLVGSSSSTPIDWGGDRAIATDGSSIDYFDMTTAANAADFGNTTVGRLAKPGILSDKTYGVLAGGYDNVIDYVTIATPGNATDFGDQNPGRGYGLAPMSDGTYGVWAGGYLSSVQVNNMDYVTIASPGNATDFGDLLTAVNYASGWSDGTYGYTSGNGANTSYTQIQYITIASPGNASNSGNLSAGSRYGAAASDATYAVVAHGETSSSTVNTIDYMTMSTTANGTDFGDLTVARKDLGACGNGTRVAFIGGTGSNVIDYVIVATPGNATDLGDLTANMGITACSGDPA